MLQTYHNIGIRKAEIADLPDVARVQVETWRQAYRGIIDAAYLANLDDRRCAEKWHTFYDKRDGRHFLYVAVDPKEGVIGFASGGPNRSEELEPAGEVYAIYVRPDWQHVGIGTRLLIEVATALRQAEMSGIIVWALRDNPARRFYESLGGMMVRQQPLLLGQQMLAEVAYSWPDTSVLTTRTAPER